MQSRLRGEKKSLCKYLRAWLAKSYDRVFFRVSQKLFASAIECVEYGDLEKCLVKIDPAVGHIAPPQRTKSLLLWDSCFKSHFTCQIVKEPLELFGTQKIRKLSLRDDPPSLKRGEDCFCCNVCDACRNQLLFKPPFGSSFWEIVDIRYGTSLLGIHYQKQLNKINWQAHNAWLKKTKQSEGGSQQFKRLMRIFTNATDIQSMNSEKQQQKRFYESHAHTLAQTTKSLEDEIELTVYNYENILQTEKKNSADRSEFLLYLIQSLRMRHTEEIQAINSQMLAAEGEREQAQNMQKQMENIGEGLDQIMEESRRLKSQNESLQKELEEQQMRQKQLDQEIYSCKKELDQCRLKVDEWERIKIKWNRQKKELLEMIEEAERTSYEKKRKASANAQSVEDNEHKERHKIEELYRKYNGEFGNVI